MWKKNSSVQKVLHGVWRPLSMINSWSMSIGGRVTQGSAFKDMSVFAGTKLSIMRVTPCINRWGTWVILMTSIKWWWWASRKRVQRFNRVDVIWLLLLIQSVRFRVCHWLLVVDIIAIGDLLVCWTKVRVFSTASRWNGRLTAVARWAWAATK